GYAYRHEIGRSGDREVGRSKGIRSPALTPSRIIVVVNLEQQATALRLERPVRRARRAAGVGARPEFLAAVAVSVVADDEIARHEVHLLPVIVHEGLGRVHAGSEPQVTAAMPALRLLVERAGQYLLLDALRISRRRLPPLARIGPVELLVLFMYRHGFARFSSIVARFSCCDPIPPHCSLLTGHWSPVTGHWSLFPGNGPKIHVPRPAAARHR